MDVLIDAPETLALLLLAALFAGVVDSIAGGGGLIALPALLTAGLPPHIALGTNKLAGTFGTLSASRAYVRRGVFKPALWGGVILATFLGALAGTLMAWVASSALLKKVLPLVILAAAAYMLLHRPRPSTEVRAPARPAGARGTVVGAALGFYDGFAGPGTGAFWTTAGMALFRLDIVHASGAARFMNFVSNLVSLVTFSLLGLVNYPVGLAMGGVLMLGAWLGAHTALRYGAAVIRPIFVVVVTAMALKIAWEQWVV